MSSLLVFCLGWCSNFFGSESGQTQRVKLLQNMVYITTQHPHTHGVPTPMGCTPQPHTACLHILYVLLWEGGRGGGGQREVRGATVHKKIRKYQHDWLYLQSINSIKHRQRRHLGFCVFIVTSSMHKNLHYVEWETATRKLVHGLESWRPHAASPIVSNPEFMFGIKSPRPDVECTLCAVVCCCGLIVPPVI